MDSLGEGYGLEDLRAVLLGKKAHTPRKKTVTQAEPPKINLLEYAVLEEKAVATTAHHNDLSAQIKATEKRMAEIAVLRTHIVNYAKTREVYVAYRKAGYSKKFREEMRELLTAKANVDRVLKMEVEQDVEKEKDHGQR